MNLRAAPAFLLIAVWLFARPAHAQLDGRYEDLAKYTQFLLGMEVELVREPQRRFLTNFTLPQEILNIAGIPPEELRAYGDASYRLREVPDEVGQVLRKRLANVDELVRLRFRLLTAAENKAFDALIREDKSIDSFLLRIAWRSLSEQQQLASVRFEHLSAEVRAQLAYPFAGALELTKDASSSVREAMKGVTVLPDGSGVIEFKHTDPIASPVEYLSSVENFAQSAQVKQSMNEVKHNAGYTYHIHISRDSPISDAWLMALNQLSLKRMLRDFHITSAFHPVSTVAYQSDLTRRGLIRRIADNRFEIRFHSKDPASELREVLELLSLPEEAALNKMTREIETNYHPKQLERIASFGPQAIFDYLEHLSKYGEHKGELRAKMIEALSRSPNRRAVRSEFAARRDRLPDVVRTAEKQILNRFTERLTRTCSSLWSGFWPF
jgi:hypothetical protein